jgi:hypothetical protein
MEIFDLISYYRDDNVDALPGTQNLRVIQRNYKKKLKEAEIYLNYQVLYYEMKHARYSYLNRKVGPERTAV